MAKQYRRRNAKAVRVHLLRQVMVVGAAFFMGYLSAGLLDFGRTYTWINTSLAGRSSVLPVIPLVDDKASLPKPKLEFYTLLTENHGEVPNSPVQASEKHPETAPVLAVSTNQPLVPTKKISVPPPQPVAAKTVIKDKMADAVLVAKTVAPVVKASSTSRTINTRLNPEPAHRAPMVGSAYMIQVAALRVRQDAERMKASLALKGFDASVSISDKVGATWFRVTIGPFATRGQAEQIQMALARREHVNGMIRTAS